MPNSAEEGRSLMMSWIGAQNPRSMLDVGAGSGTYGRLMRDQHPACLRIGVEVWQPYVEQYGLHQVYDLLVRGDVRELTEDWRLPDVDVVVLGDVLEHMTEADAKDVWNAMRDRARKAVYLSIPIITYPQGHVHGNPYEEHVVPDWTDERVLDTFPGITWKWLGSIVGRYEAVRK